MKINNVIILELVATILVNNIYLRLISFSLFLILIFYNKAKINIKDIINSIIYCALIIGLNYLLDFRLDLLNFIYLGGISLLIYFSGLKMKFDNYLSIYLLIVLIKGVMEICLSL